MPCGLLVRYVSSLLRSIHVLPDLPLLRDQAPHIPLQGCQLRQNLHARSRR